MKKIAILLLLTITVLSLIGFKNPKPETALRPIHNIQRTTKKATDKIVYTSQNTNKYHRSSCRHHSFTEPLKLSTAQKMGYLPCRVCNP